MEFDYHMPMENSATANNETNTSKSVLFSIEDGIATIILNRPERRNALSIAANERLFEIWEQLDADPTIQVAILTSADCGTFSAGMDLHEAAEMKASTGRDILQLLRDPMYQRMRSVRVPIIAAMTGHFMAGGIVLALNSDLRVGLAGTSGGITETKVGRGSPWAVPMLWMLPQPILMEMVLTGDLVPVERLHDLGFVNYVEATPDEVRARARHLAKRIRDNAPMSVRAGKQALNSAMALGSVAGFARAQEIFAPVYASNDAQEGPRAFAEKRKPVWTGK
jgi:enoyl-CoA hydratase/carnithine racemase